MESVLFWKFSENPKFLQLFFGDSLMGHANRELTQKLSQFPGKWIPQSRKTLKIFFKISGFWSFSRLIFATWLQVEALVLSLHRRFRDSLAGKPSNHEKDLDKIFKILFKGFWWLILTTCSRVNWVAKIVCFAQIGLNLRQFSKNFQFSLISRAHTLYCLPLPLPKPQFSSSIFKNRYEFSLIFNVFQDSSPSFLGFCIYVEIWKYGCWIWFCWYFGSLIYKFCWYNAYSTCFTCLFFIFMHYTMFCVVLCISCFFNFETSNDYMFLHFSLGAHFCIWCARAHTHTHTYSLTC